MPLDPFNEPLTVQGQVKKKLIEIWPTVYRLINGLFTILFEAIISMIRSVGKVIKP